MRCFGHEFSSSARQAATRRCSPLDPFVKHTAQTPWSLKAVSAASSMVFAAEVCISRAIARQTETSGVACALKGRRRQPNSHGIQLPQHDSILRKLYIFDDSASQVLNKLRRVIWVETNSRPAQLGSESGRHLHCPAEEMRIATLIGGDVDMNLIS